MHVTPSSSSGGQSFGTNGFGDESVCGAQDAENQGETSCIPSGARGVCEARDKQARRRNIESDVLRSSFGDFRPQTCTPYHSLVPAYHPWRDLGRREEISYLPWQGRRAGTTVRLSRLHVSYLRRVWSGELTLTVRIGLLGPASR